MIKRWRTAMVAFVLTLAGAVASAQYGTQEWFAAGSNPEHYRMGPDEAVPRGGEPTLTIQSLPVAEEKLAPCAQCFGTYMGAQSAEPHQGKKVRFSAFVRTEGVQRWAGLWLRVDGPDGKMLAFDNMQGRPISGDTEWTRYEIVLPVDAEAIHLTYGLIVSGVGRAWMDDVTLEEVGEEVATTGMKTASCNAPRGWICAGSRPGDYEMGVDEEVRRGGKGSAFVRSKWDVPSPQFGTLTQSTSAGPYRGKRVRLSGWVKSRDVKPGWAGLWMRVDGPQEKPTELNILAFDNMADRPISGTRDWARYEIVLDVAEEAQEIVYGLLLESNGGVWMDDLEFEVVTTDVPVTDSWPRGPRNLGFEER